jgi:hypothetical protein|tara:strand:- start:314 stop:565 length:252 start_codon:yes stop_codon:yes gene_type:complete
MSNAIDAWKKRTAEAKNSKYVFETPTEVTIPFKLLVDITNHLGATWDDTEDVDQGQYILDLQRKINEAAAISFHMESFDVASA